jgi:hypothetical protein
MLNIVGQEIGRLLLGIQAPLANGGVQHSVNTDFFHQ